MDTNPNPKPLRIREKTPHQTRTILAVRSSGPEKRLTPQYLKFIEYYLACGNAVASAKKAGFSDSLANSASYFILKNPKVAAEISRRTKEIFKSQGVDPERILAELWKLGNVNMHDYISVNEEDGSFTVDLRKVDRDAGAGIIELSYDYQGKPKIKLADKRPALETLAKLMNMGETVDRTNQPTVQMLDALVKNLTINSQVNIIGSQERHQLPETIEAQ